MTVFLLISTQQNVANVLPVLEHWREGDWVVWLESRTAAERGWTAGARQILERHGCRKMTVVSCDDSPLAMARALRRWLDGCGLARSCRWCWVTNGGTKPQSLAVQRVLEERGDRITWLYNESRPVGLRIYDPVQGSDRLYPYRRARLDLDDLLTISGHQRHDTGEQIWPDVPGWIDLSPLTAAQCDQLLREQAAYLARERERKDGLPKAQRLRRECAGAFRQWQVDLLEAVADRRVNWEGVANRLIVLVERLQQLPRARDLKRCHAERWRNWCRSFQRWLENSGRDLDRSDWDEKINGLLNLVEDARRSGRSATVSVPGGGGRRFERRVASAVVRWLKARSAFQTVVQEIWFNVEVWDRQNRRILEWDLVLVLQGGLLLVIECKAGGFEVKDLDARQLNVYYGAGSNLAQMAVVMPVYTGYRGPGLDLIQQRWQRLVEFRRVRGLPFTLPGQPGEWILDGGGVERTLPVPTFEAALSEWVRSCLPE